MCHAVCGEHNNGAHESDVLKIEFTDGRTLYIETATNTLNIIGQVEDGEGGNLTPPDFHADFILIWKDSHYPQTLTIYEHPISADTPY